MTHREIIALWPTLANFAVDVDRGINTVKGWRYRDSIPAPHWDSVLKAAERRGYQAVSLEELQAGVRNRKRAA